MSGKRERYGRGLRFPLVIPPGFGWVSGGDAVTQALRSVLLTEPGERVGRPSYGAGLRRFLFAPNTVSTRALIRQTVLDAIQRDEPRARLADVAVTTDAAASTLLRIELRYRLGGETSPRNFVFPFYLDRGAV